MSAPWSGNRSRFPPRRGSGGGRRGGAPYGRGGGGYGGRGASFTARGGVPPSPSPSPVPVEKRKPVFTTVSELVPGSSGHNLIAKIVGATPVAPDNQTQASRRPRIAEVLVGDSTGVVLFTARNEQVDLLNPGATVIFRNAKIDMFKGTMRLAVDKWGRIEVAEEPADFTVDEANNISLVEYELVELPK